MAARSTAVTSSGSALPVRNVVEERGDAAQRVVSGPAEPAVDPVLHALSQQLEHDRRREAWRPRLPRPSRGRRRFPSSSTAATNTTPMTAVSNAYAMVRLMTRSMS